ncbi:MAG: protein jag [Chloroflexi bacterium]|nr:protein jag [Chloroflexota bacterium]
MERTTLEVIAPSVEEAIARGMEQLAVPREMIEVDILDEGSKGFLGIGGRQVRVRLTLKTDEASPKPDSAPQTESAPDGLSGDAILDFSIRTTGELLAKMKIKARITAKYGEPDGDGDVPVLIDIHGDDLSVLIGRRAETLNALQYILALIVSKEANRWAQVIVDVEGYRARRERQLRQLARRMAEQAVRTGKRQLLEPMSAAERRIVHLELRGHESVTTESIGDEPNRKVSIVLKK